MATTIPGAGLIPDLLHGIESIAGALLGGAPGLIPLDVNTLLTNVFADLGINPNDPTFGLGGGLFGSAPGGGGLLSFVSTQSITFSSAGTQTVPGAGLAGNIGNDVNTLLTVLTKL